MEKITIEGCLQNGFVLETDEVIKRLWPMYKVISAEDAEHEIAIVYSKDLSYGIGQHFALVCNGVTLGLNVQSMADLEMIERTILYFDTEG